MLLASAHGEAQRALRLARAAQVRLELGEKPQQAQFALQAIQLEWIEADRRWRNRTAGAMITADTCRPLGGGEPYDLGMTIDVLVEQAGRPSVRSQSSP